MRIAKITQKSTLELIIKAWKELENQQVKEQMEFIDSAANTYILQTN